MTETIPPQRTTSSWRVLHVTGNMGIGGAERAIYQLVRGQRQQGIVADVAVPGEAQHYALAMEALGVRVFSLQQSSAWDVRAARRLRKMAAGYDLLHFHAPNPAAFFGTVGKQTYQCLYTHRAGRHPYPWRRRLSYRACRLVAGSFALSANTAHAADVLAELFGVDSQRVHVTYNGIDFDLLRPARSPSVVRDEVGLVQPDQICVATSANLRQLKRIDLLISAIAAMRNRGRMHLLVIGDGPDRHRLEQITTERGLADQACFVGKQENVADYLQITDLFCLPSDPAESFGNSAVEAMGLAIPTCVMRDGGGLVEHMDRGCGFVCRDAADLSARMDELVEQPALRAEVGAAGRDHVRSKYSIESMLASYTHVYESVLNGRST